MDSTTRPLVGSGAVLDPDAPGADNPQTLAERFRTLASEPTRLLDFVLGAAVLFPWTPPGFPDFLYLGLAASAGLVLLASLRRPWCGFSTVRWLLPALAVVIFYVVALSFLTPDTSLFGWPKRALRLVLVALLLLSVLSARVHFPSIVRGAGTAIVANAVLFFGGLAPRPYGDFLSGFLMDKNVAGLVIAVIGLLLAGLQATSRRRALVLLGSFGLLWATGSRTSLAAFACGVAWFLLRPRLGVLGRLLLAGALAYVVRLLEVAFARVGVFAEREGTDALRARIDAASQVKLNLTPWYGSGLGDAFVHMRDGTFFFHNSYWSALVEGGWVLLVAYLVVTVWFGVGPLRSGPPVAPWATAAEAANVAVLVCALRLGEVFGTTTAVLALAAGLMGYAAHKVSVAANPPPPAAVAPAAHGAHLAPPAGDVAPLSRG